MLAIILILLTIYGMPLFVCIFAAAMLGLYHEDINFVAIPIEILRLASSPVLMSIPLFTFAGYLLAEGDTSKRLIRFSKSLLGWLPGGLGVVAIISCTFFTAVTGATGVTIIALGGLLFPSLIKEQYKENFSIGLVTTGGSMGLNFPPSLPVILYGYVSGLNIDDLFIAGFIPGAMIIFLLCVYSIHIGKKWHINTTPFNLTELLASFRNVMWELPIPFLIIAGIYTGFCTATEAASITVVYVLFIKTAIHKEVRLFKDVPAIMVESLKLVGGIMIILGAALGFTNYLVDAFVPATILEFMKGIVQSKTGFLIILNLFLLLIGCMMDIFSAILIIVPLIIPIAQEFGINQLHLAVVFIMNLAIGYNTPPVGLNLFVASARLDRPALKIYISTLPFLIISLLALVVITFCPWLSLFLAGIMK
jgi:tripartite ATP-independent transporter DctM subunit